ncbi:unnamed protein product [Linum tenue]|uniref:Uncharacterized protein n=1 Tax=Linum tenue TaxID=586396 RepID=A0AAV0K991_9ROSI|nr:unnamed protein product [Linum tenue]
MSISVCNVTFLYIAVEFGVGGERRKEVRLDLRKANDWRGVVVVGGSASASLCGTIITVHWKAGKGGQGGGGGGGGGSAAVTLAPAMYPCSIIGVHKYVCWPSIFFVAADDLESVHLPVSCVGKTPKYVSRQECDCRVGLPFAVVEGARAGVIIWFILIFIVDDGKLPMPHKPKPVQRSQSSCCLE